MTTHANDFQPGDKVSWRSHGGTAHGHVQRKITSDTHIAGRDVRASDDEPQYLVQSDSGSGDAVHKPSALRRES
jgi:uncharacterized protein YijF (DUF1287 family)